MLKALKKSVTNNRTVNFIGSIAALLSAIATKFQRVTTSIIAAEVKIPAVWHFFFNKTQPKKKRKRKKTLIIFLFSFASRNPKKDEKRKKKLRFDIHPSSLSPPKKKQKKNYLFTSTPRRGKQYIIYSYKFFFVPMAKREPTKTLIPFVQPFPSPLTREEAIYELRSRTLFTPNPTSVIFKAVEDDSIEAHRRRSHKSKSPS